MNNKALLTFAFIVFAHCAFAQKIKFGVSAGLVRSFVYPQNFSTKGRNDYTHAEGQIGYMLGGHATRMIGAKTALDVGARFLSTPTYYDVALVVPNAFQVTHAWKAERRSYRLYSGLSQVVWARGNKQVRLFGGLLAGVERQRLQFESTSFSFYETYANNISVKFDYHAPDEVTWLFGAEAGFGLRLFDGVDLNLRYNYNFTPTAGINYVSTIGYDGPPGSPRTSTGEIKGRPTFAAAELVIWFN